MKIKSIEKKLRIKLAPKRLLRVLVELINTLIFFSYQSLFLHEIIFKSIYYYFKESGLNVINRQTNNI